MDGLALLCNLFADGPVTLKRLRIAGVGNLVELERTAPALLAEWLHASIPQAQAFAEEAGKLARRLAEGTSVAARASTGSPESAERFVARQPERASSAAAQPLRAGILPGLDDALCARLALHRVHTVQALRENSGLALARRTGIPYSTLLELARHARRFGLERGNETSVAARRPFETRPQPSRASELRAVDLVPFDARPRRASADTELARSDEFTLPMNEPEAAGPFG